MLYGSCWYCSAFEALLFDLKLFREFLGLYTIYFATGRGAGRNSATSVSVCLSVTLSMSRSISKTTCPNVTKHSVHFIYGRGLTMQYVMYFRFFR